MVREHLTASTIPSWRPSSVGIGSSLSLSRRGRDAITPTPYGFCRSGVTEAKSASVFTRLPAAQDQCSNSRRTSCSAKPSEQRPVAAATADYVTGRDGAVSGVSSEETNNKVGITSQLFSASSRLIELIQ